jgi:prepilin-type N-terminal cleavage/methylation domain-containing protein
MRRHFHQRAGFTLTEILVVLALIVVLGALGIGAASKGYGWVKQRATETTMTKVLERIVQRRINDIYKEAREWEASTILYNQAAGDARRADVLKVLYLYKWSFPQTYSEAFFNLQESMLLYDSNGYTHARMIWERLFTNAPTGMTPAQFIATPGAGEMARMMRFQASACLTAALATTRASSLDELGPEELGTLDEASGDYDLSDALPAGARASRNRFLADAWGNPFFFLRHGNFWDNLGYRNAAHNRAAFWCGLVNPPVAPIAAVLGPEYYDILVNNPYPGPNQNRGRAYQAFSHRWNQDPFDPEGHLRNSDRWRTLGTSVNGGWMNPAAAAPNVPLGFRTTHLCPPGGTQHQDFFRSNFGYRTQVSNVQNPVANDRWPQEHAPFVIISSGGDGIFTSGVTPDRAWDDNLDSYRLKISVSGQQ